MNVTPMIVDKALEILIDLVEEFGSKNKKKFIGQAEVQFFASVASHTCTVVHIGAGLFSELSVLIEMKLDVL